MNFNASKKNKQIILHGALWALFFLMPIIFTHEGEDGRPTWLSGINIFYLNSITKVFWVVLFYLNTVFFIPKLLYKRKIFFYTLVQLLIFAVIIGFNRVFFELLVTNKPFNIYLALFYHSISFIFTVLGSIAYKSLVDRRAIEKAASEQQKENLKTELAFLRSQISPHFIFNVLNNIVALVRLKSNKLEPTILKLSALMQYMLYETEDDKALLKSEVDYLQSYIDLQQMRFGDRIKLKVSLQPEEDWHAIEPMLLIPFVENAFKHGTGMIENPVIDISLQAVNNQLTFSVKNKYLNEDKAKDKISGIGLNNVKRRLQLLYGKSHSLNIEKTESVYCVTLSLTFKQ